MKLFFILSTILLLGCETNMAYDYETVEALPQAGKKVGWSGSAQLTTGGNKRTSVQANFDKPGAYTIQFDLIANKVPDATVIRCYADITWSVEGNSITRRITVGSGQSVTGVGQAATIVFYDDTILTLAQSPINYVATCSVAPGSRASTTNPPILVANPNFYSIPFGGSLLIDIPQNVGVISVRADIVNQGTALLANNDALIVFRQGSFTQLGMYYPLVDPNFVVIPPGALQILLSNLSASENENWTVTFGIDG